MLLLRLGVVALCTAALASAQKAQLGVKLGYASVDATEGDVSTADDIGNPFLVGPTAEFGWDVVRFEFDALYRPLRYRIAAIETSRANWEFPIMAKLRIPFPHVKPFAVIGPVSCRKRITKTSRS